ncbi:MAG: hypothetical protein ACO22X_06770 [Algoriphagus sp.]|jgi:hypothetical protein
MKKIALTLICLCLFFEAIHAQSNEKNLILENLIPSLSSDRILSNIVAKKNGRSIPSESLKDKRNWDRNQFSIEIRKDSIRWKITDLTGENFYISYPNDYSLFYGKDKKVLQDELIELMRSANLALEIDGSLNFDRTFHPSTDTVITKTVETKYGILKNQFFENQKGERIFSDKYILESIVNSLMFPEESNYPYAFRIAFHKYGSQPEEFRVNLNSIQKSLLKYENWSKWSAIQEDYLLVLFEHPFLNFHHMLIIKNTTQGNKLNGEFYSFIPNSNFEELFSPYRPNKELLEINIKNLDNQLK